MNAPRIILVSPKSSANVGSAARAMKNFGLTDLYLVAPRCRIDAQAHALASHAGDVLDAATTVETTEEAVAGCTYVIGTTARDRASEGNTVLDARSGITRLPPAGGALMFGPEDSGLNNRDLDRCQAFITLPTSAYASVNLAQAVNIIAYEWFSGQAERSAQPAPDLATRDQLEGLYRQMLDVMLHIGYTDPYRAGGVEHIYRRLLDRAEPTAHEVAALRGLFRQALWAANQPAADVPGNRGE